MKNLEQIRAAHALKNAESIDKRVVNGVPALIVNNGLLAAAAFANDGRDEILKVMDAVASYLAQEGYLSEGHNNTKGMIDDLTQKDSIHLQRAGAEALAYLGFLKRFATKKNDND